VRVGNLEATGGGRKVFGAVAKANTDITTLIRQSLRAVRRTDDTDVTASGVSLSHEERAIAQAVERTA
jgi:hypothetical protein